VKAFKKKPLEESGSKGDWGQEKGDYQPNKGGEGGVSGGTFNTKKEGIQNVKGTLAREKGGPNNEKNDESHGGKERLGTKGRGGKVLQGK